MLRNWSEPVLVGCKSPGQYILDNPRILRWMVHGGYQCIIVQTIDNISGSIQTIHTQDKGTLNRHPLRVDINPIIAHEAMHLEHQQGSQHLVITQDQHAQTECETECTINTITTQKTLILSHVLDVDGVLINAR